MFRKLTGRLARLGSARLALLLTSMSTRAHQEEAAGTQIHLRLLTADVYSPANEGGETQVPLSESLSLRKVCNARRTGNSGWSGHQFTSQ